MGNEYETQGSKWTRVFGVAEKMNWGFKKFSTEYEIKKKTSETTRILEYKAKKPKKKEKIQTQKNQNYAWNAQKKFKPKN